MAYTDLTLGQFLYKFLFSCEMWVVKYLNEQAPPHCGNKTSSSWEICYFDTVSKKWW